MLVSDLVEKFDLNLVGGKSGLTREVRDGYCGDLLSEVMANAPEGCAWMTVQGHQNIIAVAVLRNMAAIIITGGQKGRSGRYPRVTVAGFIVQPGRPHF
jgi:predicted transcriptional regulator